MRTQTLKEIKELRETNTRIDNAETRITEAEDFLQNTKDATLELLELRKQFKNRVVDQEGRSGRENRIQGVKDGAEDSGTSVTPPFGFPTEIHSGDYGHCEFYELQKQRRGHKDCVEEKRFLIRGEVRCFSTMIILQM